MLVVLVVALILDPIVYQLVRHELQALTSSNEHCEHAHLNEEVADEVAESQDYHQLVAVYERVQYEVGYLEREDKGVDGAYEIGAASLKLEGGALTDCTSQHHDCVQIQG